MRVQSRYRQVMDLRRAAIVLLLVTASCGRGIDARTESARKRILALDAAEASRIVSFCKSWREHEPLPLEHLPPPTTASAEAGVITFAWWNNSHAEEDESHPGFELVCSARAVAGGKPIAAGLWYRDAPMNSED
jgi:hypothetical protein